MFNACGRLTIDTGNAKQTVTLCLHRGMLFVGQLAMANGTILDNCDTATTGEEYIKKEKLSA